MRQPEQIINEIAEIQCRLGADIKREHLAFRVSLEEMSELFRYCLSPTGNINPSSIGRRQGCTIDGMRVLLDTEIEDSEKE
ncbi:MAG: hypothetical protein WC637_12260 [Victivallales bacterium]|jgi:hypothetical protein